MQADVVAPVTAVAMQVDEGAATAPATTVANGGDEGAATAPATTVANEGDDSQGSAAPVKTADLKVGECIAVAVKGDGGAAAAPVEDKKAEDQRKATEEVEKKAKAEAAKKAAAKLKAKGIAQATSASEAPGPAAVVALKVDPVIAESRACNASTDVTVLKALVERCRKRLFDIRRKRADDPALSTVAEQRSRLKNFIKNKRKADLASAESVTVEELSQATSSSEAPAPAEVVETITVVPEIAEASGAIEQALEVVLSTSPPPLLRPTSPLPKVQPKSQLKKRLRPKTPPPAVEVPGVEEAARVEPTPIRLHAS